LRASTRLQYQNYGRSMRGNACADAISNSENVTSVESARRNTVRNNIRSRRLNSGTIKSIKPGDAGLYDRLNFRALHFASLAIWCASRDTFRLALFL